MPDPQQIVAQLGLSAEEEYQLHLERGRRALNTDNLIEAKSEIDKCLAARPGDSGALNLRALLLFKLEEYDDAIRIFKELVERFPQEAVLVNSLGLGYLKKTDYETAAMYFERACKIDHNYAKAHNYLGFCYQHLGRYREAREEFLLGGSRSMAARMEELLAEAEQAGAARAAEASAQQAQEDLERMIKEPEPEKPSFASIEAAARPAPAASAPALAGQPSARLAPVVRNLTDTAVAYQLHYESDAPCAISEGGVLRMRGQTFSRLRHTLSAFGSLEFRPRLKRYKGKDLKSYFGSDDDPIHELVGEGVVYIRPPGRLVSLPLEDEIVYVLEDRVYAFAGDLRWENGRLPGENGGDLLLVQFKGAGNVVLHADAPLRVLALPGDLPARFPAASLVGWFGEIVPRLTTAAFPGLAEGSSVVEFQGRGHVLFEMPAGATPPPDEE